jgi:hypothetical protein
MTAHGSGGLLIIVGGELLSERCRCIRQYYRRDGDIDEFPRCLGQYRPVADGKKRQAKVREDIAFNDCLRRQTGDSVVTVPSCEFAEEMRGIILPDR